MLPIRIAGLLLLAQLCAAPFALRGQCMDKVSHTSGTQQVGCTNVTVTSAGSAGSLLPICGKDPYFIGNMSSGSYTFTFSPAVSGVRVSLYAVNNQPAINNLEEVAFTVNGSFYPITNPGVADGCLPEAEISPTGKIRGCTGCISSWDDLEITTPINALKVEDIHVSGSPAGVLFSLYLCCAAPSCQTDAGQINAAPLTLCGTGMATVPAATQTLLEPGDLLQYILFADPNDTLGSILATSNTPSFGFNPALLQPNITYYICAVAGNNQAGNVNLSDPCLDFSNAIPVVWRPYPTVALAVGNPNLCAGACTEITATFTGTAPFTLTYFHSSTGATTQSFSDNIGVFSFCTSPGAAPGPLVVQAVALEDAWCSCP
ncbi:MAG: hypothetical protein IT260_21775 [Saprospiraceae bacterium]|nr:hypothetical protein [Saprospiraceae bacterium]